MPSILIVKPNSAKTVPKQCQNHEFLDTGYRPLQLRVELHQKDLRIIPVLVHIWVWPGTMFLRADMFLALSLIVAELTSRRSH